MASAAKVVMWAGWDGGQVTCVKVRKTRPLGTDTLAQTEWHL